jgi:protein-tyrosine-phosphatase/DNA-binding transcriptional ArsR family regulator
MMMPTARQSAGILKLLAHDLRWGLVSALTHSDLRVTELVRLLDQPMNLVSYHLRQLREQQLVTERRSSADSRDVYYSLDIDLLRTRFLAAGAALHPALASQPGTAHPVNDAQPVRILFLCTHNSARSQMAEGIMRQLGGSRVAVFSAGSEPSEIHPEAVRALAARGIEIGQQRSKHLSEFAGQTFDYVITVCDRVREQCPHFSSDPEQIHWSFADPAAADQAGARERAFAQTAQQLTTRIRYLLEFLDRKR